jgi:hypothetical protein
MSNHQRNYILFLIAGSGLVAVARAMTLSFLAIKGSARPSSVPFWVPARWLAH